MLTDVELLYFSVLILYIIECIDRVDYNNLLFLSFDGSNYQTVHRKPKNRLGLYLKNLIPSIGYCYSVEIPKFYFGKELFVYTNYFSIGKDFVIPRIVKSFKYDEIQEIFIKDSWIYINNNKFCKCDNQNIADEAISIIHDIGKENENKREQILLIFLKNKCDFDILNNQNNQNKNKYQLLKFLCSAFGLIVFVIFPFLMYIYGYNTFIIELLIFTFFSNLLILHYYYKKSIASGVSKGKTFKTIAKSIFYPISTIRICDNLSNSAFLKYHPIAVALLLSNIKSKQLIITDCLRDLKCPQFSSRFTQEEFDCIKYHNDSIISIFIKSSTQIQKIFDEMHIVKVKKWNEAISFCPRCLTEYKTNSEKCSDCNDIKLEKYTPSV